LPALLLRHHFFAAKNHQIVQLNHPEIMRTHRSSRRLQLQEMKVLALILLNEAGYRLAIRSAARQAARRTLNSRRRELQPVREWVDFITHADFFEISAFSKLS
jgi:predicted LPLAT superfamily acyltransferase